MKTKNIAIIAGFLIIAGAAAYFAFNWKAGLTVPKGADTAEKNNSQALKNGEIDLAKISWNKIEASRLAGFDSRSNVVELTNEGCGGEGHYLRIEGGYLPTGYCLAFSDGGATTTVDSAVKLKEVFAPVDSEEKAVSFVAVSASDYKVDKGVVQGYSAAVAGGYLVKIIHNNTFGCDSHKPAEAIYKVTESGDVSLVSRENPIQDPSEPAVCVD